MLPSTSLLVLVGFVAWTLLLVVVMEVLRSVLTLARKKRANDFAVDGRDVSPFAGRLSRAHANCLENLPVVTALVVVALLSKHGEIVDPLAPWLLGARILQSTVHLVSTSVLAVLVRFTLFVVQLAIMGIWTFGLLRLSAG
jgi:uncharacterized MAPEG superfamily protein